MMCSVDYDNLEDGLKHRGFVGIENIDSMRRCNKDDKHFILRTDGLIIYTNYPWTHTSKSELETRKSNGYKDYRYDWGMENFSFKELDEIIEIVEL